MIVYDNVLPKKGFDLLESDIVNSTAFPWFKTVTTEEKDIYGIHDHSWFHMVYKDGEITSQVYNLLYPLMICAFDKINEPVNNFLRFRLALQTPIGRQYINDAHVDDVMPHKTAILYLNSSDGSTIIYNEKYDPKSNIHSRAYRDTVLKNNLTIGKEVEPLKNRLVVFDGLHYHSSQRPLTQSYRVILNINYN